MTGQSAHPPWWPGPTNTLKRKADLTAPYRGSRLLSSHQCWNPNVLDNQKHYLEFEGVDSSSQMATMHLLPLSPSSHPASGQRSLHLSWRDERRQHRAFENGISSLLRLAFVAEQVYAKAAKVIPSLMPSHQGMCSALNAGRRLLTMIPGQAFSRLLKWQLHPWRRSRIQWAKR